MRETVSSISVQDYDRLFPGRLMPGSLNERSMYRLLARSQRIGGQAVIATAIFEGKIRRFGSGHILGDLCLIGSDLGTISRNLRSIVDEQGYWMPASGVEVSLHMPEIVRVIEGYLLPAEACEIDDFLSTEVNLQRYDMLYSPPLGE